ncbi:MAG: tetratricopeptide repeat protein [Chthoniobacterales bacterium]
MDSTRKRDTHEDLSALSTPSWLQRGLLIGGSFLVVGSVILAWLKFPYSFNVGGWELPIQALVPHIHEFSYGLSGIAVLAAAFFLRKRFRRSLLLGAAILVTLWLLVPARISFHQAPLLRRLSEESQAVSAVKAFTASFLHQNDGSTEEIPKHRDVVTLPGRIKAAFSILGPGWYCFGFGSILVGCYAVSRLPGQRVVSSLALIAVPAVLLTVLGVPSVIGQRYFNRGARARAAGDSQQAIANYRRAMRSDSFYTNGLEVYTMIGQLERQAGLAEGSAERAISRAADLRAERQFEPAIKELRHVAETNRALAKAARHEALRIQADWGLARYHAGAVGDAVEKWQQALAEDSKERPLKSQPSVLYVLPYLARGNYELGHYEAGLDAAKRWADVTGDHSFLQAGAYLLAEECSKKLGRDAEARRYSDLVRARMGK